MILNCTYNCIILNELIQFVFLTPSTIISATHFKLFCQLKLSLICYRSICCNWLSLGDVFLLVGGGRGVRGDANLTAIRLSLHCRYFASLASVFCLFGFCVSSMNCIYYFLLLQCMCAFGVTSSYSLVATYIGPLTLLMI